MPLNTSDPISLVSLALTVANISGNVTVKGSSADAEFVADIVFNLVTAASNDSLRGPGIAQQVKHTMLQVINILRCHGSLHNTHAGESLSVGGSCRGADAAACPQLPSESRS